MATSPSAPQRTSSPQQQQQPQEQQQPAPHQSKPIQPIQIKKGDRRAAFKTFCSYGAPRSGKTRWLGTWPRLLVIADATERGWTTLETMPDEHFYEAERPPLVWPVEDAGQMAQAIADARPLVDRGEVLTLGIDSLTFYGDTYFNWLRRRTAEANKGKPIDTRALYGALADHLQDTRIRVHTWPCNVGWLALERAPDSDDPQGSPMLTGKARKKFPAGCDHIFYHRSYTIPDDQGQQVPYYEMHTAPFGYWMAGGRDSGMLPPSMFNPTYREFAELLGLADPFEAFEASRKSAVASTTTTRRVVTTS